MATDAYLELGGVELINLARTVALADAMSIDTVWVTAGSVEWVKTALGGTGYGDVTNAPWYDAGVPASAEFAGFVSLGMVGLDDDTLESTTTEYVGDGGNSGKPRNKTLPVVASVVIIAATDRGADYGKRWLDKRLRSAHTSGFCSGATLRYFRHTRSLGDTTPPPMAHRRDVSLTRGTSVTRKQSTDCAATWFVTYTWTCNDPFEYGESILALIELGLGTVSGPLLDASGNVVLTELSCPVYNYTPIYDPLYPALVTPPPMPDFLPAGWGIADGQSFKRYWADLDPIEPSALNLVPIITVRTDVESRRVRVSIWPSAAAHDEQCEPLFVAICSYVPVGVDFTVDGEQRACYAWDGASPQVRRTDSLVYGTGAAPLEWTQFNDPAGLWVSLDVFADSSGYEGDGTIEVSVEFVPTSA